MSPTPWSQGISEKDKSGGNVVGIGLDKVSGEFTDHQVFLDLVKREIRDRPVLNTLVVVLDAEGHLTVHSSTADTERVLALATKLQLHAVSMWDAAILKVIVGEDSPAA